MAQDTKIGVSIVRRWQLAAALKALREQADLTQEHAVEQLASLPGRWSRSKLSRIENREHNIKPLEVEQMLDAYGITDTTVRERLMQLATNSNSREHGWWVSFSNELPENLRPLLSIESGLVARRDFQTTLIPGLLQTADYARALMSAVHPATYSPQELERKVAARMVRQQMLAKDSPPQLHFILDQSVLERLVGRPSIMRDQLRKLLDETEAPNITVQILPRDTGGSPGLEGPFSIFTLPDPIPDIGYTEGPAGMVYIENREHVHMFTRRFRILSELALAPADSASVIAESMRAYG
jgi:transcriptional regulator with XRE-family HTH domain